LLKYEGTENSREKPAEALRFYRGERGWFFLPKKTSPNYQKLWQKKVIWRKGKLTWNWTEWHQPWPSIILAIPWAVPKPFCGMFWQKGIAVLLPSWDFVSSK
jgi:hypothetical protein